MDGLRRALRAWPVALMLTAPAAALAPALELTNRMAAADFGLGGFPFHIANRDYYLALTPAEQATLAFLFLVWVFLSGGVIDRLARDTRSSGRRFFAACGACFGPLIRLALIALAVYAAVLMWIEPALARAADTDNNTVRMSIFGALAVIIFTISLVLDYARMRLVVEDRRSAFGALLASLRFIRAYPRRTVAAQALFWLLMVAWMSARYAIEPQTFWLDLLFIAGMLFLKLALIGTQCANYQSVLASAGWVARAEPKWPDEPGANPAAV